MDQDPDQIRQYIEDTRAEMSETVEAIGYKADVPSRAKDKVSETVDNLKNKVSGTATGPGRPRSGPRRAPAMQ